MNVRDLCNALLSRFPVQNAEPWDHVGLSVGNPADEVKAVVCALDATEENVLRAVECDANVLLTHHPVYIKAPDAFTPATSELPSSAAAVYTAARMGVSIISLHTNLDRSMEARMKLPELMGLPAVSSLEYADDPERLGLGSLCRCPDMTLEALAKRASVIFETRARVWGDVSRNLQSVAFLGGSLGDFGELAVRAYADAVVTGESGYHVAQDLCARGLCVVLLGHDRSEQPFCAILSAAACDAGVPQDRIHIISHPSTWWTVA